MRNRRQRDAPSASRLLARLDRAAHDINTTLLVLAIGLATLDATCFVLLEMRHAWTELAVRRADHSPAAETVARPQSDAAAPGKQMVTSW